MKLDGQRLTSRERRKPAPLENHLWPCIPAFWKKRQRIFVRTATCCRILSVYRSLYKVAALRDSLLPITYCGHQTVVEPGM